MHGISLPAAAGAILLAALIPASAQDPFPGRPLAPVGEPQTLQPLTPMDPAAQPKVPLNGVLQAPPIMAQPQSVSQAVRAGTLACRFPSPPRTILGGDRLGLCVFDEPGGRSETYDATVQVVRPGAGVNVLYAWSVLLPSGTGVGNLAGSYARGTSGLLAGGPGTAVGLQDMAVEGRTATPGVDDTVDLMRLDLK